MPVGHPTQRGEMLVANEVAPPIQPRMGVTSRPYGAECWLKCQSLPTSCPYGAAFQPITTIRYSQEKLKKEVPAKGPGTKAKRTKIAAILNYIRKRTRWMNYGELQKRDLVIATGVIEGAARYVIGERMDCSGMRWIDERAEMLLRLRCIEINGEWDQFFSWTHSKIKRLQDEHSKAYRLRPKQPAPLPNAA